MHWILVTVLACCYGFFRDLRPSDGYLTHFLTSDAKNLTLDQINNEIYPCKTYAYAVSLVPILMFADFFKYRSLLILDAVAFSVTYVLILWTGGILAMKSMQVVFGLAAAGELGYMYYMYPLVEKEQYQKCSSFLRFSALAGRFLAYLLGQLFISYDVLDLFGLNAFSLSSGLLAFVISLFLPKSKEKVLLDQNDETDVTEKNTVNKNKESACANYKSSDKFEKQNGCIEKSISISNQADDRKKCSEPFTTSAQAECYDPPICVISYNTNARDSHGVTINSINCSNKGNNESNIPSTRGRIVTSKLCFQCIRTLPLKLKNRVNSAYSNRTVILWSVWWMTAMCGNFQIGGYIQNIYETISPHTEHEKGGDLYNGAVEAAGTLIGAVCVFLVGFLPLKLSKVGRSEVFMTGVCVSKAVLFAVLATTSNIWVAYVSYCLYKVIFQVIVAIKSAEVAKAMDGNYYGFVFGFNMFIALSVETVFTIIFVDQAGLGLDVRKQFLAYSGYSGMLSGIFLIITIVTICKKSDRTSEDIVSRL